jgi:hypothetical protein
VATTSSFVACSKCGRTPAQQFKIRRHVAMLFQMRMIQVEPVLCRECAKSMLLEYTGKTLVQGWWGPISLFVANPATIVMNLLNILKAQRMPRPTVSQFDAGATPEPKAP